MIKGILGKVAAASASSTTTKSQATPASEKPSPAAPVKRAAQKVSAAVASSSAKPKTSTPPPNTGARDGVEQVLVEKLKVGRNAVGAKLTEGGPSKPTPSRPVPSKPTASTPTPSKAAPPAPTQSKPGIDDEAAGKGAAGSAPTQKPAPSAPNPELAAQQQALGNAFGPDATPADQAAAASYFEDHDTYIDPQSGVEYDATFDPNTGEVTLRADDRPVRSDALPGGSRPEDQRPLDDTETTVSPRSPIAPPPTGSTGRTGGLGGALGKLAEKIGADKIAAVVDGDTDRRMSTDEALATGVVRGIALLGGRLGPAERSIGAVKFGDDKVDAADHAHAHAPTPIEQPEEISGKGDVPVDGHGSTASVDEVIVLQMDGDRQTTRTFSVTQDEGGALTIEEKFDSDADGTVTSGTVTRDGTTASEQFHTVDTIGQGGVVTRRERRDVTTTPDGAVTTQVGTGTFTDGKPTGTDQTFEYRFGPATATEHTVTEYVDGAKSTAVIDQHAVDTSDGQGFLWLYDQEKSGRISLTYGDDGQVVAVSQSGGGLNDVVSDHPTAAGETFVFTNVHTEPGDVDGVPTPALITGPGIIVHEGDVEIFQEGGIPGQAGDDAKQISDIRSYIQASPEGMRETLEHVNLLDGRNPQDVYWESEYGIEDFTSGAVGGGGQMTYFLGGSGESTFYHELGHISGTDGGAPDDDAWGDAIESDAGIDDTFMEQGVVVESGGTVGGGLNGVSDYADTSYTNSGSESEDWADSVELWLHSRRAGGLVTVKLPDGSTQTATFEELYPGRAAILEAFYGE